VTRPNSSRSGGSNTRVTEPSTSTAAVRLLGLGISVYTRIARLTLEEKRVGYAFDEVDVFADGGPPADYLRLNPFGLIPSLVHGDFRLYETAAICRYVDEAFAGPPLQPREPAARARMAQIVGVLDHHAYRPMVWDVYVERAQRDPADEARIAAALPRIDSVLRQLDGWRADSAFLGGDSLTLADLHAYPILRYLAATAEGESLLGAWPRLLAWMAYMRARPSVIGTRYPSVDENLDD